jgi:aspartate-semialdehyde dehydrogenase
MPDFYAAIIGATGLVGQEFTKVLLQHSFPMASIQLYAWNLTTGRKLIDVKRLDI